jgi:hypothetical protein
MNDIVRILIQVLIVALVGSVPVWLVTRRSRRQFKERFGRQPTNEELDSLGAWLKDPPPKAAGPHARQTTPSAASPKSSFGDDPRA